MDQNILCNKIMDLIESSCTETAHADVIKEIIGTALRLTENHVTEKDVDIIHIALKEMRYGMKFFSPYKAVHKISIFGSARTKPSEAIYAYTAEFAKRIADAGFMVITGAGEGIMRAAQEGAGRKRSFGINILLPFEQSANQFISDDPKLMTFKYFFTRKLFFIKEANAIALFPGGFGTHDEGFEALTLLQTGKGDPMPVVFMDVPGGTYWTAWRHYVETELLGSGLISPEDLSLFKITDQIDEAIEEITTFYRRYHSIYFVDEQPVLYIKNTVDKKMFKALNENFSDIVIQGEIAKSTLKSKRDDEVDLTHLSRITFHFDKRSFGRLRQMIDFINRYE